MPHFVTFCGDFGISPLFSASMLAMIGVFDLIGTVGSGWLSDRFDNRWLSLGTTASAGCRLSGFHSQAFPCSDFRCSRCFLASISSPRFSFGSADSSGIRARASPSRVRLVFCGSSIGRRRDGFRSRPVARCAGNLSARVPDRRRALHRRGDVLLPSSQPAGTDGTCGRGVIGLEHIPRTGKSNEGQTLHPGLAVGDDLKRVLGQQPLRLPIRYLGSI